MDLSSATPGQQQIITALEAPLSVAAGAGSGKTFTLTNRIAYALLGGANNTPCIDSVDEVLAITFSRSGAAELKSRIRALLQEEGLEDQARAVENAWITTIHGMCSRILREHALELAIDPAFEVVEDTESEALWQRSLEAVLERWRDEDSTSRLKRLIEWFPPTQGPRSGISAHLTALWEKTLSMPDGFESVHLPEVKTDIDASFRALIALGEEYQALAKSWDKLGKHDQDYLEALEAALAQAENYLQEVDLASAAFDSDAFDMQAFFEVLLAFPKTSEKYRANKPDADFFRNYRETYAQIAQTLMQEAAVVLSRDLLELLKLVDYEYQQLKGADRLDNTDLLRKCCEALEMHPSLRETYQQQFKLIMVDEFQDTDLLQVAIINNLSRNHGANVMTVGDAQQSIYRFRGADVEVFFRHRNDQHSNHEDHQALSLPDNFRSHGDILKFVDAIFSRQAFFGDEFLSLQAKGKVNSEHDPLFDEIPRVQVEVLENRSRITTVEDVRKRTAVAIAHHFAQLRSAGASPGKMVILLGGMSNVATYSRALAEVGFESIITAGSVFAQMPEVRLIESLLTAFADQANSTALYQVLASPLFNLSDAAFYAIGHVSPDLEDGRSSSSFAQRFWALCDLHDNEDVQALMGGLGEFGLRDADMRELLRAIALLQAARGQLQHAGVHAALHALFVDSGWLYRLQESGADGLSTAANLFKALGFVADWEAECRTLYQIADDFAAFLQVSNQTPGVLATLESEYVRIMTIHSSKGLEFDHVAVAEIRNGLPRPNALRLDTCADDVLFSLHPAISTVAKDTYKALMSFRDEEPSSFSDAQGIRDMDAATLSDFLDERIKRGELDDAQRLLYVGLTRAVKSLYLCLGFRGDKDFCYENKGMFGLLHEVLNWDKTPDSKTYTFDFGGTKPGIVHHEVLLEKVEEEEEPQTEARPFAITPVEKVPMHAVDVGSVRFDVISYSSIAPDHTADTLAEHDEAFEFERSRHDEEMSPEDDLMQLKQESATALGTAFHRLAQRAIESRFAPGDMAIPPESAFEAQVVANDLSLEQTVRLRAALDRWFASDLCARFMASPNASAEVPFMLVLEAGDHPIFLEGEIDGLAFDPDDPVKRALFIDYKTGGSDQESDEELHEKHLLQAQCYALALMRQGFDEVEAHFIRVERACPSDPAQPQVVPYTFTKSDRGVLEEAVMAAYRATKG